MLVFFCVFFPVSSPVRYSLSYHVSVRACVCHYLLLIDTMVEAVGGGQQFQREEERRDFK